MEHIASRLRYMTKIAEELVEAPEDSTAQNHGLSTQQAISMGKGALAGGLVGGVATNGYGSYKLLKRLGTIGSGDGPHSLNRMGTVQLGGRHSDKIQKLIRKAGVRYYVPGLIGGAALGAGIGYLNGDTN